MKLSYTFIVILFQICLIQSPGPALYCCSYCDSTTDCTSISKTSCTTCAPGVFVNPPDIVDYPANPCQLQSQTQLVAE